jgi:hypothetical protein
VACADLDGDGHIDLLTADSGGGTVSMLRGDGRGGFAPFAAGPLRAADAPHLLALGDVNGDGALDLAVSEHDRNDVHVFLGDGAGGFRPAPGAPFAALRGAPPHNHGLGLADLDGDGALDLTTSNQDHGSISALRGDGRGGFAAFPGSPFHAGRAPYPHALGDLNGDGRTDVVVPDVGGGRVAALLGAPEAGLEPAPGAPVPVAPRPYAACLADLDGDGRMDAVLAHDDIDTATVLRGDGAGGFEPGTAIDAGRRLFELAAGDLDGDGRMDVAAGAAPAHVVLLRGDGRGGLSAFPGSPLAAGGGPYALQLADVDGDARLDLVVACSDEGRVHVLLCRP